MPVLHESPPCVHHSKPFAGLKRPQRRDRRKWQALIEFTAGYDASLTVALELHRPHTPATDMPTVQRLWRVVRRGGGKGHLISGDIKSLPVALIALSESVRALEAIAGPVQILQGIEMDIL